MRFDGGRPPRTHGTGEIRLADFRSIGTGVVFEPGVLVFHPEQITIGDDVYVGHGTILKGYYRNEIVIGDGTWIGQRCFFHGAGGLRIGRAVGVGPNVTILTSEHDAGNLRLPILHTPLLFREVVVGDGADLGAGTTLLPGVGVGAGALVGAGAVVSRDLPDYCVAAGVPARVLRDRCAT